MFVDERVYIVHTDVAYFDDISVEDFVEFVGLREMLMDQVKEKTSDVGGNISTEGWAVPDNVATPVTLLARWFFVMTIGLQQVGKMCVEVPVL